MLFHVLTFLVGFVVFVALAWVLFFFVFPFFVVRRQYKRRGK